MKGPCSWCGKEGESCLIIVSNRENRIDKGFICDECLKKFKEIGRKEAEKNEGNHVSGSGAGR